MAIAFVSEDLNLFGRLSLAGFICCLCFAFFLESFVIVLGEFNAYYNSPYGFDVLSAVLLFHPFLKKDKKFNQDKEYVSWR